MADMIYLYAAYTVVWIGIFLYVLKLHLSQRKLKKDIEILKEMLDGKKTKKDL